MLKPSDNPPVLAPWVESLSELKDQWWVGHTKGRFEKAFAWDLLKRRIGHFLPLMERVRFTGGRKRRVMLPLFSSYVFFCGSEEDRYAAMATNRLCKTIEVIDQESLVKELLSIEKALLGKARLDPYPFAAVGKACRVAAGPFAGIEGSVIERSKVSRLVLHVGILGQGAAMEIDSDLLEPID
jgi:transcriptional antiterminator RfaH